jgi:cytochrome P450
MSGNVPDSPTPTPDQYDLYDPAVQSEPYELYRSLHAHCPVYKEPQSASYVVSNHANLKRLLLDPQTYSNQVPRHTVLQRAQNAKIFTDILRERGWEHCLALQRADPPEHQKYRKIVLRALNPGRVASLAPRMRELANQLIDGFIDRGGCDFLNGFALPFPGILIAEQIGLDAREIATFKKWADNSISVFTRLLSAEELRAAAEIELQMQHYLANIFAERRAQPRADLVSMLVNPQADEEALSMRELQTVMSQLINGGYDTVISALSHGMWQLIRFPEVAAELRADPSRVGNFINESLRWESPVQGLWRTTTRDTQLGGASLPAGSVCITRYGAANRDPAVFADPDRFDIHRTNGSQHLAFGAGVHFCPGSALARQELTIAWQVILERMEDFRLDRALPDPVHHPSLQLLSMKELMIAFRRRSCPVSGEQS